MMIKLKESNSDIFFSQYTQKLLLQHNPNCMKKKKKKLVTYQRTQNVTNIKNLKFCQKPKK